MPGSSRRGRRIVVALALAAATLLAAAAPAPASLLVDHFSTATAETAGNSDGLIGPGDTSSIDETVINSETSLTNVTGALTSSTPGVSVSQAASPYPDMGFGDTATNTAPFSAALASTAECGVKLQFSLTLNSDQGTTAVPFAVPTGTAGPARAHDSTNVPRIIPDVSSTTSNLYVVQSGRVKDVRVRVGHIAHDYVGDLKLELIAPNGVTVVLADAVGGDGDDFRDTVFAESGFQSVSMGAAPFTGTYRPQESLAKLNGLSQQGTWRLRISDQAPGNTGTLNSWGADVRTAVCNGSPQAAFTATPNPVLPGETVTFDASGSTDANGTIVAHRWDLDGDGDFETDSGTAPVVTRSFPQRGDHTVRLLVRDDSGATGTTTSRLSVTEAPTAALTVTPATPETGEQVTLDASGSIDPDPDGAIVRYEWDLDADGIFERDTGPQSTTTVTFAQAGPRSVAVRVTDEDDATDVQSVDFDVLNRPPSASFTAPAPALVGVPATFDASASSDSDGPVVRYEWDLDGNGSFETDTAGEPIVQRTYAEAGDVNVGLRVTDSAGATADTQRTVRVTRAPTAAFTATPNPVSLHRDVTFDAAASSDPDGPLARYEWDLDGNGSYETDTGATPAATRSYSAANTYAARLRVTDADGATATATVNVLARNLRPSAALAVGPNPARVGQLVTMDARASTDPDGTIAKYDWDLDGNGTYEAPTGASGVRTHAYPHPGIFDVGVRVTDSDGGTATQALRLTISAPPAPAPTGGTPPPAAASTGAPAATAPGAGAGPGGALAAPLGLQARLAGPPIQRAAVVARRGLAVACTADRAVTCRLRAELRAGDARRLGLRARGAAAVRLGTATVELPGAGTRSARLRLSAAGRRALRRARGVTVVVRGTMAGPGGAPVSLVRGVLVRR